MDALLEKRKLIIIEFLADLQDEKIILQIENLLKPSTDFWDELSDAEKSSIERGISQFKQGQKQEYKDFLQTYFEKKNSHLG